MSISMPQPSTDTDTGAISTGHHDDDAIIRVASYHRRDFNLAVIHSSPAQLDSSGTSLFKGFGRNPDSTLGPLEVLPLELLSIILLLLDLQSAFRFSHVNNRAKKLIADIWEYRQTREHVLQCLQAALRTRTASSFGVSALYIALVTKACSLCGAFGRFFFLLTATQCCLHCLESAPEFALLSAAQVCKKMRTSRASLTRLIPTMCTIPGKYGMWKTVRKRRVYLVAKAHCSELQIDGVRLLLDTATVSADPQRYMASSSIPYLDITTGGVETGLSCKGCQVTLDDCSTGGLRTKEPYRQRDMVYSREGFLEHFQQCGGAKAFWESCKGVQSLSRRPYSHS